MTVAELIEKLREMPQDARVMTEYDAAAEQVESVALATIGQRFSRNLDEWEDLAEIVVVIGEYP